MGGLVGMNGSAVITQIRRGGTFGAVADPAVRSCVSFKARTLSSHQAFDLSCLHCRVAVKKPVFAMGFLILLLFLAQNRSEHAGNRIVISIP